MSFQTSAPPLHGTHLSPLKDTLFINGEFVPGCSTTPLLDVVNPGNKEIVHQIHTAGPQEVDAAVVAADAASSKWSALSATVRAGYLKEIAKELDARRERFVELEMLDNGKVRREAESDVSDSIACFEYYATLIVDEERLHSAQLSEALNSEGSVPVSQTIDVGDPGVKVMVEQEAVGVAALIVPWNYPLLMAVWKIAPCLAAGSVAILKPSEITSLSALEFASVCQSVSLPAGVFNVVCGDGRVGALLTEHKLVSKVAFTGSTITGSKVAASTAHNGCKSTTLELGGKSPMIVCKDARRDSLIDWICVGIFFNSGQVCSATSRLLLARELYGDVLGELAEVATQIKVGAAFGSGADIGPIVSEGQYERVRNFIIAGVEEGATLYAGAIPPTVEDNQGYFVSPVIFTDVTPSMSIWKEEIFGPVLCVAPFDSEEEAIDLANDSPFGLAASVMSNDQERATRISRALRAGVVWMNSSQPTYVQAPWGGYKASGVGRELGPWGLNNYRETKQILSWDQPKGWEWFDTKA